MRRKKLFSVLGAIALIAVMVFSFVGCEQKIGSGSNEDAINIINKGFETDYGYTRFYWNATLKTKAVDKYNENNDPIYVVDAKGQPVYNTDSYNVQFDPTDAENPKGYFYSSKEKKANVDNAVETKVDSEERWLGKYYETKAIREAAQSAKKEDVSKKGLFLLNKIVKAGEKDSGTFDAVTIDTVFSLPGMAKYNIKVPLDMLKDMLDSGLYDVIDAVKSGVVNTVTLKMKGMYIGLGNVQFTVLDIVDENKKQTTMLSSVSNDLDSDSDYYNKDLNSYFTYNFLDAGSKINPVTNLSAEEFIDSINNPKEAEKDLTMIIIIAVVVVVVLLLLVAYFVYRNIRKKKHAEFMARKEAANEAENDENALAEAQEAAETAEQIEPEAPASEEPAADAEADDKKEE